MTTERQLGLRPPFQRRQPQLLQPGRLGAGDRRAGQLAIGGPRHSASPSRSHAAALAGSTR